MYVLELLKHLYGNQKVLSQIFLKAHEDYSKKLPVTKLS